MIEPAPRPQNVPADWTLGTCAGCGGPVWYDPGAERVTLARGLRFLPVCSNPVCVLAAIQAHGRRDRE